MVGGTGCGARSLGAADQAAQVSKDERVDYLIRCTDINKDPIPDPDHVNCEIGREFQSHPGSAQHCKNLWASGEWVGGKKTVSNS